MKNVCKKWKWSLYLLLFAWVIFFTSCTSPVSSGERTLPPDTSRVLVHKLFPNDMAKNDSAAANLAHGIMLVVHPKASYTLSFEIDSTQPAPELQLFRTYEINNVKGHVGYSKVRTLTPTVVGNRYVYSFNCEENKMSIWATSLGVDGQYYEGNVHNISFKGEGSYSDHFSINLIVVGTMEKTADGMDIDELSRYLLESFREKYYDVTIDTLYVRYAHEHPTLGSKYPENRPWVAGRSSDDDFLSDLAGWPEDGLRYALNLVLVHSIDDTNVMGYSHLFTGNFNTGTVVVGTHVITTSGEIENEPSKNIMSVAVHETGHFFGLRHTSTTRRDLSQEVELDDGSVVMISDRSNMEDGMTDTDFCEYIYRSGLYKQADDFDFIKSDIVYQGRADYLAKSGIFACKDKSNIMFPVTLEEEENVSFSKQQMELVRASLSLFPH